MLSKSWENGVLHFLWFWRLSVALCCSSSCVAFDLCFVVMFA